MIDFRYHVVSLVSVFLALAVGIVLGAGPLKDSIGTTLTKEVQQLRQDRESLKAQLNTSETSVAHRDDFIKTVAPSLINGQLTGRSVAIVTLPGVKSDDVDALVDAITAAGGTVTGRVSIGSGWVDPNQAANRTKVITDLTRALPAGTIPATGEPADQLSSLLAGALVSSAGVGEITPDNATVLKTLRSASLIGTKGDVASMAGSALLLVPPNADVDGSGQEVTPTDSSTSQDAYLTLATALDTDGGGAVVSGPGSAALGSGVLAALRDDDTAKDNISTVDSGSTPMGVIAAVLALREQLSGGHGAYGSVGSGTKVLPALTTDAGPTATPTPTPTPTKTVTKK
jgi:hypothetical protein